MATPTRIILLGVTQGVGQALLPFLMRLAKDRPLEVHAISRQAKPSYISPSPALFWHMHDLSQGPIPVSCEALISVGPIHFATNQLRADADQLPRVIWALSSASTDFKSQSSDLKEQGLMTSISQSEQDLEAFCQAKGMALQLFKTTMLYGRGDRNVNRLAELIEHLPWVPIFGQGNRAPVHVDDVARLIALALGFWLNAGEVAIGTWRLQGGEVLSYPAMLKRIAKARGLPLHCIHCPLWMGRMGLVWAHAIGRLQDIQPEMLRRQGEDLTVDDHAARQTLSWRPRGFEP